MGWGNCGTDSKGRPIGYNFPATCDKKGCKKKIDRGLSYACGGMHGEDEVSCEGYFCEEHLVCVSYIRYKLGGSSMWKHVSLCEKCYENLQKEDGIDIE
jgi:hypothetical protein